MASKHRGKRYQSTDESTSDLSTRRRSPGDTTITTSNFDEDLEETESEEMQIRSDPIRSDHIADPADRARTWPKSGKSNFRGGAQDLDDDEMDREIDDDDNDDDDNDDAYEDDHANNVDDNAEQLTKRDKIKHQGEKLAIRAKETGGVVGAEIRRRSLSAGRSVRKRSRSAGRAVKAASISAGKEIRKRSISAGKGIRKRSISAGKEIRKRSISAGKEIKKGSISAGKVIRKGSINAGRAVKAASISAGNEIRKRSISAGKGIRKRSISAGKGIRKRSISAGKEIRKRSISAGRSIRASSISAGKFLSERSSSAGESIRKGSASAGKRIKAGSANAGNLVKKKSVEMGVKMKDKSKVAGKLVKKKSVEMGVKMKDKSKVAGKMVKEKSIDTGRKMKEGSKVAGKKITEKSKVAGKKMKEKSKSAGKAMRKRSISATENLKRRKSSTDKIEEGKGEEEEEEEEEENEEDEEIDATLSRTTRGVAKMSSRERWGASWNRSKTMSKVKFENAKLKWNRKLNRMPRPRCVRPEMEGEDEEDLEETGSRRTQVEVFEIPSRGSSKAAATVATTRGGGGGGGFQSPPRIVYRDGGKMAHYFSVLRNGQELASPAEETDEEEDDEEEEFLSPMPEEEEEEEEEAVEEDEGDCGAEEEDEEEEADGRGTKGEIEANGENDEADEDEEESSLIEPVVAVEQTCRDEILGADFVAARESVEKHRLHLGRISTAIEKNLRRGPRIGGRIDALRETFKGRKLGQANDRRLARRFAKFSKVSGNPAAEAILKDTGRCFERSSEVVDDLEDEILHQFLHPLKTFMESDSKTLRPKEKKLQKLADKIVLAKREGVMAQRDFDDLSQRFENIREELSESYSCILSREDEETKRLAEVAGAYTKFNRDNYVVYDAALDTLKQSLDQLEKSAEAAKEAAAFCPDSLQRGEGEFGVAASKTEASKAASSSFAGGVGRGVGSGVNAAHWITSASSAAGQGDAGKNHGSLFTGGGMTGMIHY